MWRGNRVLTLITSFKTGIKDLNSFLFQIVSLVLKYFRGFQCWEVYCRSIYLSVHLSVHLSIYLSIRPSSIHPSVHSSIHSFIIHHSVCPSIHPSNQLPADNPSSVTSGRASSLLLQPHPGVRCATRVNWRPLLKSLLFSYT